MRCSPFTEVLKNITQARGRRPKQGWQAKRISVSPRSLAYNKATDFLTDLRGLRRTNLKK